MTTQRKLETILTENKLVSEEQLKQITNYAFAVGIDLHEAVLQKKVASPEVVMMAYAESVGIPFVRFADLSVDEELVMQIDPVTARQHSFIPVSKDHGHVLLVSTKMILPDTEAELRMQFNMPIRCAICTPAELSAAIAQYYPRGAVRVSPAGRIETPQSLPIAKKSEPKKPMNDAEKWDRFLKTFATFNFTVAFFVFAALYSSLSERWGISFITLLCLGAIVGGVTAGATWKMLSR